MKIRTTLLIVSFFISVILDSCSQNQGDDDGFSMTESGLKYKFIEQNEGRKAEVGYIITFHMAILNEEDSILSATFMGHPQPIKTEVPEPSFKGSLEEGLSMMAKGDSAIFMVPMDSIYKDRPELIPPNLKDSKYLKYRVRMLDVQTKEEIQAAEYEKNKEQRMKEEQLIKDYMAEKGLEGTPTSSGLYHVVTKEGSGENPSLSAEVTVHYTGSLLNGSIFDSSLPGKVPGKTVDGSPITYPLSGFIPGWQEGIALMKKGESAILIIPSHLGYGEAGTGGIPPNSVLVFEVELFDFTTE